LVSGRSYLQRPIPLAIIILVAVVIHGPLLLMELPATTSYDANLHIFFGSHYAQHWFDPWNEKWFAGFSQTTYPPLTHQWIALLSHAVGLTEGFMLVQLIAVVLLAVGTWRFARLWVDDRAASLAALLSGEIDLYVEYTGNAGLFFNDPGNAAWKDLRKGYELGARLDYAANHIVWLTPADASNAWALAVRHDVADANHLRTMSDFARWVAGGGKVVLVCSAEFANAGTLRALERTYRFMLRSDQMIVLAGGETSATITAAAARPMA